MTPDQPDLLAKLVPLLFMMMGPVGVMPLFAGLSAGFDDATRRQIAFDSVRYAAVAMCLAVLIGASVLAGWGATPASLILASGVLLLIASLRSLFPAPPQTGDASPARGDPRAIALSPLAFPGLIAPHCIGIVVVFVAYLPDAISKSTILAAALCILALDFLAMLYAHRVMAIIGMTPLRILGAVFGVLQVALAIEMLFSGLARSKLMMG